MSKFLHLRASSITWPSIWNVNIWQRGRRGGQVEEEIGKRANREDAGRLQTFTLTECWREFWNPRSGLLASAARESDSSGKGGWKVREKAEPIYPAGPDQLPFGNPRRISFTTNRKEGWILSPAPRVATKEDFPLRRVCACVSRTLAILLRLVLAFRKRGYQRIRDKGRQGGRWTDTWAAWDGWTKWTNSAEFRDPPARGSIWESNRVLPRRAKRARDKRNEKSLGQKALLQRGISGEIVAKLENGVHLLSKTILFFFFWNFYEVSLGTQAFSKACSFFVSQWARLGAFFAQQLISATLKIYESQLIEFYLVGLFQSRQISRNWRHK